MVYFTADTHFFHKNVISYCNRPFKDLDDMHTNLIKNWNSNVSDDDYVWILGDYVFGGVEKIKSINSKLNGKKILLRGNHDDKVTKKTLRAGELGFHRIIAEDHTIRLWPFIGEVVLSHYPYKGQGDSSIEERYIERRPTDEGKWLLHGHVHTTWGIKHRSINVGVDIWEYTPVSQTKLYEIMDV